MTHLISFQFILQFTIIYIFEVGGALGRGLVVLQLYWNHTLAQVLSCKFAAYFQNTFS